MVRKGRWFPDNSSVIHCIVGTSSTNIFTELGFVCFVFLIFVAFQSILVVCYGWRFIRWRASALFE